MRFKLTCVLCLLALAGQGAPANIDPSYAYIWSANSGWIDGLSGDARGVSIGLFHMSGYAWSPNTGWIHFGDGTPANGYAYGNTDGGDYGVSVDGVSADGRLRLRGLAWSPNTGWLVFEDTGNPCIDIVNGGILGHVWSPNMGWITIRTDDFSGWEVGYLPAGADSDGDTIPDAFEWRYAGDLATLSPSGDADGDGSTDKDEFIADTDPLDNGSTLRIVQYSVEGGTDVLLAFTSTPSRTYRIRSSSDLTTNPLTWPSAGPGIIPADIGSTITVRQWSQPALSGPRFHIVEAMLSLPE